MPDRIHLRDLHVRTIIGLNDWERNERQEVILNLVLEADLRAASSSDDIEDAVNYRDVAKMVIACVEESRFLLIERLAGEVANVVLAEFPAVRRVTVSVDKPTAVRYARSVAVEISRARES